MLAFHERVDISNQKLFIKVIKNEPIISKFQNDSSDV